MSLDNTEKIGRGTWLDKVADDIIKRENKLSRNLDLIRVESGLGASGIPHVGNASDAIRAHGIRLAIEDIGYKSELITYSDDLDGLRKVPDGLPEELQKDLGMPVSRITDPFGCHNSFGHHMSSILHEALDEVNVKYTHISGAESYRNGILNDNIKIILENSELIGKKISDMLGQDKFEKVLPYYPICDNCGKLYTALATEYLSSEEKILYTCKDTNVGTNILTGCDHTGELKISSGNGKLSWKSEFAARWSALDIRYEAYGKDIIDSVNVNDWISDEILNFPHPYHVKYELFLDKTGKKISKSLGNVFTPQTWLQYGTQQSLFLLMFKRIAGARSISASDIPVYMDDYDNLEDVYFGRAKTSNLASERKLKGLYEYVNNLKPPSQNINHVPYRLLAQLSSISPSENRLDYVLKKLKSYRLIEESNQTLESKIDLAFNWSNDLSSSDSINVEISDEYKTPLLWLKQNLTSEKSPDEVQNIIFETSRKFNVKPRDFFKILYVILLNTERGPKLGPYIVDLGIDRVKTMINDHLNKE